MPAPLTRRAFLKLTALFASGAAFARLLPGRAIAAARACLPVWGMEVPTLVPTVVGDDCAPPPTATETPSATATASVTTTATSTASPTATATVTPTVTPPATPTPWRWRLPWVTR